MAGIVLDSELHAIAKHLVKLEQFVADEYQGVVTISKEVRSLNERYSFVSEDSYPAFEADVCAMYQFERDRQLKEINKLAFVRFKLDNLTGNDRIGQMKNELAETLGVVKA